MPKCCNSFQIDRMYGWSIVPEKALWREKRRPRVVGRVVEERKPLINDAKATAESAPTVMTYSKHKSEPLDGQIGQGEQQLAKNDHAWHDVVD